MHKLLALLGIAVLLLAALAWQAAAPPTWAQTDATPQPPTAYPGKPLPATRNAYFAASGVCAACHTNMTDLTSGKDVSIDAFWRSTMMANAARDPLFQAGVRAEIMRNPDYREIIEDKCATCHTPMLDYALGAEGQTTTLLDDGLLNPENPDHLLAADGVSCTVCHQIEDVNLGQEESFSGHFSIDTQRPDGSRLVYGPFRPMPRLAAVMQETAGYVPVYGQQVQRSELCATCHTLYTPYLNAEGEIAGEFPEQTPYLEWLNSTYRETQTCQNCHMPFSEGRVRLSVTGGPPRGPFAQHYFVGGNIYVLTLLQKFGEELGVTASRDHFAATITRTLEQLQNSTAALAVQNASLAEGELRFSVQVTNLAGHKFPTGYPARRAWLHVIVRDADGNVIFESGAFEPNGRIIGNANDEDAAAYEPHYDTITAPDQVQIYETIMHTAEGDVTTTLLRGAGYIKDNRLLPDGFDKANADPDIAVYGQAAEDANFSGGGDTVSYAIAVQDAPAPYTVTVQLLYQSVSYRWVENFRPYDVEEAPEVSRFLRYYDTTPNVPVVVSSQTLTVEN